MSEPSQPSGGGGPPLRDRARSEPSGAEGAASAGAPASGRAQVLAAIPHRPPFLWVDEVVEQAADRLVARKWVDPAEPVFQGHYPDFPLLPGVLVCEAIFQAGAILLASKVPPGDARVPVMVRVQDARFKRMVRPGDVLDLEVVLDDMLLPKFDLTGKARVGGELAVSVKFSCALAPRPGAGERA